MRAALSTAKKARRNVEALVKRLNQEIRQYLRKLAHRHRSTRSIAEFKRLSGSGHSRGWRYNRDEIRRRS
jgi:chorismate mutase